MDRRVQRLRRVKQTITRVRRHQPRNNHGDARLLSNRPSGSAIRLLRAEFVSKEWQGRQDSSPRPAVLETAGICPVPWPDIAPRPPSFRELHRCYRAAPDDRTTDVMDSYLAGQASPKTLSQRVKAFVDARPLQLGKGSEPGHRRDRIAAERAPYAPYRRH